MKINSIKIKNFRNLNDAQIYFHPDTNYIIGENNIGKSNLLFLMNLIFSGKGFDENDFINADNLIEIELSLRLAEEETGFFNDYFSPTDPYLVNLKIEQRIDDVYPSMYHIESGDSLPYKFLKKAHYINYNTNAVPDKSLRFDSTRGMGTLFKSMTSSYIQINGDTSFLNEAKIDELKNFINERLKKIHSFNLFSVEASIVGQPSDILAKLFSLSNGDYNIRETGCGVQFMAMASVDILCQIMDIYKKKGSSFSEQLYEIDAGIINGELRKNKILPLVLAIDEPEVHLHPFLQRTLIGYYKKILKNQDADFCSLLKSFFDIDGLDGQLLVVTHSTDALLDDHRNLIRLYKRSGLTKVACGVSFHSRDRIELVEKHLPLHFPEIKEAFYAKSAVLIEGPTEFGCMRLFAEKLDFSLDEKSICVVNAGGEKNIRPIQQLLASFGILSVALFDGDVREGRGGPYTFFTNELCFEVELVKELYNAGRQDLVKNIATTLNEDALSLTLNHAFGEKWLVKKLGVSNTLTTSKTLSDIDDGDADEFCNLYSSYFMSQKGILLGRIVGNLVPKELIPRCYSDVISAAIARSEQAV